jgi:hypothetical protein
MNITGAGATQSARPLSISGTATLAAGGNKVLVLSGLALTGSGKLDLNDNDFILDYSGATQLPAVQGQINSARNGGDWLGNGITSTSARTNAAGSTTLAAMEASDYDSIYGAGALFNGIDPDATAVLVKYTYYGDADFSGEVDFDDYVRVDGGFNNALSGWMNGDLDGSGEVDFDDYVLIDLAFNSQSGAL